jgi:carboxyl-terminal processing protease
MGIGMMNKFNKLFIIVLFTCISSTVEAQFFNEQGLKFIKLLNWLDDHYVDSVNTNKLTERAIIELLQKLDPHSSYISKEEVEEMNEPLQGNFEGIGISFSIYRDTVIVINAIPEGPSEKVGIHAGDRIVQINDTNITGLEITTDVVFSKLRGKKGSVVKLHIKRKGVPELLAFNVSRDKIPIHSVEAAYKIDNNIGYIRISRFSSNTIPEFQEALAKLKKQNINGLILDLSGNGGGFLDVAVSLADEFIDKQKLIVYTQGLHSEKKEYFTSNKGNYEKGRVVVIIDESSASASEIFAGAIQDWDRGILVGRRSFGKGLVQRPFTFPDGSMVRLTIARYYTPSGRLIQKSYSNGYQEYSKDILHRINNGELTSEAKNQFTDTLKYYTLLKNRVVYAGGGIMPDVFVSLDTSAVYKEVKTAVSKGVLNKFVVKYIDENRELLAKKYSSFDIYKKQFSNDTDIVDLFLKYADSEKQINNSNMTIEARNFLAIILEAYIARDLWSNSEFFEIYNQTEEEYQSALKVMNNWQDYQAKLHLK